MFEVRVQGGSPSSLPALVAADGTVLVPLRAILELTGTPFELSDDGGRISVARPRGAGRATLDLGARTIVGTRRVAVGAGEAVRWGADIFIATQRLADLVEGQVTVDVASVAVVLARDPPFPAQERAMLAEARRGAARPGAAAGAAPRVAFRPRTGAGVLEWGVSSTFPDASLPSAAYARAGLGVWGGMLRVGANTTDGGAGGEVTASYQRVFPNARIVRQLQVGALVTDGLRARSVRGISITNAPFLRDPEFGEARFAPQLPAGWEYELYQDGQLLGYSNGTGAPVSVPLRYGSTPVQVRLYGPAGERVRSDVVYLVPTLQLPRGTVQYGAGAGLCPPEEECQGFGYADVRGGLTDALTLLAGTEAETDSIGTRLRPYAGASLLPARGLSVEAQAMPGAFYRLSVDDFSARAVSGSLGAGVVYPRPDREVVGADGFSPLPDTIARWHAEARMRLRYTGSSVSSRAVELGARMDGSRATGADRLRLSASASVRGVLMEGIYESSPALADTGRGRRLVLGRATVAAGRLAPGWLGAPLLTGAVGTGNDGLEQWEAGVALSPRRASMQVAARWNRGGGTSLVVSSSMRAGPGRAQGRVGTRNGRVEGGVSLDGGVAYGSTSGIETLPFGGVGMAGVEGRVFHDVDGDGRFGPGDEPVENAAVGVGSLRTRTGADGKFATWAVLPYEIVQVRLDTATLADPGWVPLRADTLMRPSPHLYTRFEFPLAQTREMIGKVEAGRGVAQPAGVSVELVNTATGAVERAVTFSDGEFYIGRVLPGAYELRIAESSLRALNARPESPPTRIRVAGRDASAIEVPPIRLVRNPAR